MQNYYYIGALLVLCCCAGKSIKNYNEFYDTLKGSYVLKKGIEKKIPLDTLSNAFIFSYDISQNPLKGYEEYIFLNQKTNSVYFYNWEKSELDTILVLPNEGPNGVGLIKGFKQINEDSLFLFASNHTLSLTNRSGYILAKMKTPFYPEMPKGKKIYNPSIEISGTTPLIFENNKFYMTGSIDAEFDDFSNDNSFTITMMDFESGNSEFIIPFPDIYYNGNWVGAKFRKSFTTYNDMSNEIIISYPASHQLVKYDLNKNTSTETFGASNLSKSIVPMDTKFLNLSSTEKWAYFIQSDSYGPILWDPYRKVYYRILLKGKPNADNLTGKVDLHKDMSIILLSENFFYLGETELPGSIYENNTFFVTKEGLAAFNYDAYKQDENFLSFDIFELVKL